MKRVASCSSDLNVNWETIHPHGDFNKKLHHHRLQWISVAFENSVAGVSSPDNKHMLLILSGHKTLHEIFNTTIINCNMKPMCLAM